MFLFFLPEQAKRAANAARGAKRLALCIILSQQELLHRRRCLLQMYMDWTSDGLQPVTGSVL